MSADQPPGGPSEHRLARRSLLALSAGAAAATLLPSSASARVDGRSPVAMDARLGAHGAAAKGAAVLPPVLQSRQALLTAAGIEPAAGLPITQNGTTYNFAQVVRWLSAEHFVVGRWDGTMSIFDFETAPFVGPMVTEAVNTPSARGVQMVTKMAHSSLATSNDAQSILLWRARRGRWTDLELRATVGYDASLGAATSGAWFPVGSPTTLVVGHDTGFLSLWSFDPGRGALHLIETIDVRNPAPVNPWGAHTMYGLCPFRTGPDAIAVAGSDDGYVSIVRVPGGELLSQTVFNPSAQRGINSVSVMGDKLLVANCSVGADDDNLWYFSVDQSTWALTLLDSTNLIIDTSEIQSFNFDTKWGRYPGGPCWFAGTEEGALWMGTAGATLDVIGFQPLGDGAIGAALDYRPGGRLSAVIQNLFQFTTGA